MGRRRDAVCGQYAGGIFWIVGTAVLFSWVVSGIVTPYLAVKMRACANRISC